ncbi:MAG: alanine racemase [Ruminococcaceae bacterium]|jgi:alanine racemase|nr:alanine racemase [Oscillospiraceae bacterium]
MDSPLRRTWSEIDLDHLAYNFEAIRRYVGPEVKLLGVVKGDAYGHGSVSVARKLAQLGADYLAVSNEEEAAEIRNGGVELPILILGFTPADQSEHIIRFGLTQTIADPQTARAYDAAAARAGARMKVHIKLDTGMGRLGFQCDDAHFDESLRDILSVLALPSLDVEGVFTHFAVADEDTPDADEFTCMQHERFVRMLDAVEKSSGFHFRLRHCCSAGGTVFHPEWAGDMVRCGILLYGTGEMAERLSLRPVMRLKTVVSTIKEFESGIPISYGRTFYTQSRARIAVLPIGYADGLHRALSNLLVVRTPYGEARQVGRICMDMCMLDVTDQPDLKPGDEVEVYGEHMLCETAAKLCGTISYELLSAVARRVPRIYFENGKQVDRVDRL